ncbi:MAG: Glu/Leu/Phe/Val dehydrogenase dimerization domain-containing protein [Acidobacteriota bacterium]
MDDEDGYTKYEAHVMKRPYVTEKWQDDETEASAYLVIDSLKNGAAGGGTRMRKGGSKQEALFLAKAMDVKFRLSGPEIGGAKSVIDFSPDDDRAEGVLSRYFRSIARHLRSYYGTAGDLGVRDETVSRLLREELDIRHPQEGILRGHLNPDETSLRKILSQLGYGVGLQVPFENNPAGPFTVETMITGYGIARSLHHFYAAIGDSLAGKRVIVEGFGVVGGPAAYYLARAGARIVGILTLGETDDLKRWALDERGLDVSDLLLHSNAGRLTDDFPQGINPDPFLNARGDIFIPAATSHTINRERINQLCENEISVIACGANSPFYVDFESHDSDLRAILRDAVALQREADERFSVIADFIANCGTARLFAYLMQEGVPIDCETIFTDVDKKIGGAVAEVIGEAGARFGLLGCAYDLYLPDVAAVARAL